MVTLTPGDIVENTCAGDSNPIKFGVFLRHSGRYYVVLDACGGLHQYDSAGHLRATGDRVEFADAIRMAAKR